METNVNFRGVSAFFYFAIPAVLALAAIWWLAFGEGLHYFRRALSQERRRAEAVGALPNPKTPIEIKILTTRDGAIAIDRAEIDGGDAFVYLTNRSQQSVRWAKLKWSLRAPDGTIIEADDRYINPSHFNAGDRTEMKIRIDADPRAAVFQLEVDQ